MAQPKDVIAKRACFDCKEMVQIKLNKNYLAYYFCPHCNASHRFNRETSAELAAKFDRMFGKPANDNQSSRNGISATGQPAVTTESEPEPEPETSPRPDTGADAGADTGKRQSKPRKPKGGDWFNDLYGG